MADITKDLSNILNNKSVIEQGQYGKDVRAALAAVAQASYNALAALSTDIGTDNLSDGCITKEKLADGLKYFLTHLINGKDEETGLSRVNLISSEGPVLLLGEDGRIVFASNLILDNVTDIQTRVCKKIDDLNGMTPDLNTIESNCNCIDIIADMSDEKTGYCQLSNCPDVQEYGSYGFHFTRLYNVEYFRSDYDYILWTRKDKGGWIQMTTVPNVG